MDSSLNQCAVVVYWYANCVSVLACIARCCESLRICFFVFFLYCNRWAVYFLEMFLSTTNKVEHTYNNSSQIAV